MPSALLSYISMQDFLTTQEEVHLTCTSRVVLKNPKCLSNSKMYEEQVFNFFHKMYNNCELRALILMT